MRYKSSLLYCLSVSLALTACSNKKCIEVDKHDGLVNALTCDYKGDIQTLQISLDDSTLERNKLFHNYQRLIARTLNKSEVIDELNQNIQNTEREMDDISMLFQKIKTTEVNPLELLKLKQKLRLLSKSLVSNAIYFEVKDALKTKKELKKSNKKNTYIEVSTKIPKQNFSQTYQEDINKDKEIKLSFSSEITTIQTQLNGQNIAQMESSFKHLMVKLEKYNQSIKL